MGLTRIHIHICYFILTQLILNYKIFWHNFRYGEGNTISFGYDKAEMPHALVWDGGEGGGVSEDSTCNSPKSEYRYVIFNFLCMINGCNLHVRTSQNHHRR